MTGFVIRCAQSGDFEPAFALLIQLWFDKALNRERQRSVFNTMIESAGYELLCAELDRAVIGFASLSIQHNFWQGGRILYITTMIVDERHRKQGIGTALIREIDRIAAMRGCGRVELESSFHRRAAHDFYEKMGFEKRAFFFSKVVQ